MQPWPAACSQLHHCASISVWPSTVAFHWLGCWPCGAPIASPITPLPVSLVLVQSSPPRTYHSPVHALLFYQPLGPVCMLACFTTQTCVSPPAQAGWDILLFCLCGAVGQLFIFATIKRFGSLVNTLVTTTRKFFNILLSGVWKKPPREVL